MLKANGIVPAPAGNKRPVATQLTAEDVEIEDNADEIKLLEVGFCDRYLFVDHNWRYVGSAESFEVTTVELGGKPI